MADYQYVKPFTSGKPAKTRPSQGTDKNQEKEDRRRERFPLMYTNTSRGDEGWEIQGNHFVRA
jgi:hypothetical protein